MEKWKLSECDDDVLHIYPDRIYIVYMRIRSISYSIL